MSETWTVVFLGIIALSTFVMMAIQVGAIIYAARMAKRLETVRHPASRRTSSRSSSA